MNKLGRVAAVGVALLFTAFSLNAQAKSDMKETKAEKSFKGYLADKMCGTGFTKTGDAKTAATKAKKHTKDCALADHCKESGYGLIFDGKFHKFNDAGDKLAVEYLTKTKKESNLMVHVKGTLDGDKLAVASLTDAK